MLKYAIPDILLLIGMICGFCGSFEVGLSRLIKR